MKIGCRLQVAGYGLLALFLMPLPLHSSTPYGIVAVVGDAPISTLDVQERLTLMVATSGLTPSKEVAQKLAPQIIRQLIDEELQRQEATKRGIKASETDLAGAVASIEAQNERPAGSLKKHLAGKGIPWRAFLAQVKAQLLWQKIMAEAIRPKVRISDSELQRAAQNRRLMATKEEINITPLVLPVEKPELEPQVKALAQNLVAEVRAGADLEEVARQFTKAPPGSEPNFWVPLSQMEPALANAIKGMNSGTGLLDPIRTRRGYQIIRVNERRATSGITMEDPTQIVMKEVMLGLPPEASPKRVELTLEIAAQVASNPGTCLDEGVAGVKDFSDTDIKVTFLRSTLSTLPEYARMQAQALSVGEVGEPFATPEGIRFYILCEKVEMPVVAVADEKLRDVLFREKMELEASRFMRNLRRSSFVELR